MSDIGFPVVIAPIDFGEGDYVVASTGQVNHADYDACVLHGYADKSSVDTPGWPTAIQDNFYQRVGIRNTGYSSVHGNGSDSVNGDHYSASVSMSYLSGGSVDASGDPFTFGPGADGHAGEIQQVLDNKLIDKLLEQKFNLAQFIAEREQLVSLVRGTAHTLANSIRQVRRGDFLGAVRSLTGSNSYSGRVGKSIGGIPEQWLALQYGWKPLLSDIHGAAEELANLVTNMDPPVASVRVKAKASKGQKSYVTWRGGLFPSVRWTRNESETLGWAFVEYKLASDFGQTLARTGITNPYALAWETLPYSFVVDWAIPVGTYLTRLNFDVGLRFSRGWRSLKTVDKWTCKLENKYLESGNFSVNWSGGSYSLESYRFDRTPFGSFPLPAPPQLQNPLSLTHCANALSLMATGFGRPASTFDFVGHRGQIG